MESDIRQTASLDSGPKAAYPLTSTDHGLGMCRTGMTVIPSRVFPSHLTAKVFLTVEAQTHSGGRDIASFATEIKL